MLIYCLIPIAAVIFLSFMSVESTYLYFFLVLMCPIMMFVPRIVGRRNSRRGHG